MSKKGNYIGGSTVKNTMTRSKAKFLDDRMFKHLEKQKSRKSDQALSPEETKKILQAETVESDKKQRERLRKHAKIRTQDRELQERYKFLEQKKAENPSIYIKSKRGR